MQNLDFDFEKCCSVSLTHVNVYVCLVCGKYFQVREGGLGGRGWPGGGASMRGRVQALVVMWS